MVVIFDLHDLVALAVSLICKHDLCLAFTGRIQRSLKEFIQPFYSQLTAAHWCQHLDLLPVHLQIAGQLIPKQREQFILDDHLVGALHDKEIFTLIVEQDLLPVIDSVSIYHNIALPFLPEDSGEHHEREAV